MENNIARSRESSARNISCTSLDSFRKANRLFDAYSLLLKDLVFRFWHYSCYTVVDFGCGDTWLTQSIANGNNLVCFEPSNKVYPIANRNLYAYTGRSCLFNNSSLFWRELRNIKSPILFIFHNVLEFMDIDQVQEFISNLASIDNPVFLLMTSSTYRRLSFHNMSTSFLGGYQRYSRLVGFPVSTFNPWFVVSNFEKHGMSCLGVYGLFPFHSSLASLNNLLIKHKILVKGCFPAYMFRTSLFLFCSNVNNVS
jgi:hypothetical protein